MSKRTFAPLMALGLVVLTTVAVAAQASVSDITLSDSVGGQPRSAFPLDTETVYVGFDYTDADNTSVGVVLEGLGLTDILYQSDRYSGTGHADVPIAGSDVYESLAYKLVDAAEAAQASAKTARDASVGLREYLQQVEQQVIVMNTILDVFDSLPLEAGNLTQVLELRVHVADLARLSEEASQLEYDQQTELQAKAREMKDPAAAAVQGAEAISDAASDVGTMPLPTSGTSGGEYTVQLLLGFGSSGGSPAADASFTIQAMSDNAGSAVDPGSIGTATAAATQGSVDTGRATQDPTSSSARSGVGGNATTPPKATDAPSGSGSTGSGSDSGSGSNSGASGNAQGRSTAVSTRFATGGQSADDGAISESDDADGERSEDNAAQPLSAAGGESAGSGSDDEAAQGGAMPTWTVPAGGQLAYDDSGQQPPDMQRAGNAGESGSGGTSGRNLLLLAVGVVALIGVAFWLRGRV